MKPLADLKIHIIFIITQLRLLKQTFVKFSRKVSYSFQKLSNIVDASPVFQRRLVES